MYVQPVEELLADFLSILAAVPLESVCYAVALALLLVVIVHLPAVYLKGGLFTGEDIEKTS